MKAVVIGGLAAGVAAAATLLVVGMLQAELRHLTLPMLGAIAFLGLCVLAWLTR